MIEENSNEANGEDQRCIREFLETYEQLDKEAKMLTVEKEDLFAIEEELYFMLHEELENRRKNNLSLRSEVEEQKRKCVELTRILNTCVREQ